MLCFINHQTASARRRVPHKKLRGVRKMDTSLCVRAHAFFFYFSFSVVVRLTYRLAIGACEFECCTRDQSLKHILRYMRVHASDWRVCEQRRTEANRVAQSGVQCRQSTTFESNEFIAHLRRTKIYSIYCVVIEATFGLRQLRTGDAQSL